MSVTITSRLNQVKTYNNIVRDPFLRVVIYSFLYVMIHASAKQEVHEKRIILMYEPMREQNGFHVMHISAILRLEPMEYFTRNSVAQQCTAIQSNHL